MGEACPGDQVSFTWLRYGRPTRHVVVSSRLLSAATLMLVSGLCTASAGALFAGASFHRALAPPGPGGALGVMAHRQGSRELRGVWKSHKSAAGLPRLPHWNAAAQDDDLLVPRGDDRAGRCSGRRPPDLPPFQKRVALTFDDGPDLETTPALLAILREAGAPAAFFVNGNKVVSSAHEHLVQELNQDPLFLVGNHGWSHRNLSRLELADVTREVEQTSVLLERLGVMLKYFRFPFGHASCEAQSLVQTRHLRVTGWHVSSADWCYAERDGWCRPWRFRYVPPSHRRDMVGYVMRQLARSEGGIVLLHDQLPYTVDKLPELLAAIRHHGYRLVPLDDVRAFPRLNALGPVAER